MVQLITIIILTGGKPRGYDIKFDIFCYCIELYMNDIEQASKELMYKENI